MGTHTSEGCSTAAAAPRDLPGLCHSEQITDLDLVLSIKGERGHFARSRREVEGFWRPGRGFLAAGEGNPMPLKGSMPSQSGGIKSTAPSFIGGLG
jgi:hypothetical protein